MQFLNKNTKPISSLLCIWVLGLVNEMNQLAVEEPAGNCKKFSSIKYKTTKTLLFVN